MKYSLRPLTLIALFASALLAAAQTALIAQNNALKYLANSADPAPPVVIAVTRGPYLQRATPNAIVVRWSTSAATDSRVRYGSVAGVPTYTTDDAAVTQDHQVAVSGLIPDSRYYYSVGSTTEALAGGDANHYFTTHPPTDRARPLRFWALGDAGTGTAAQTNVRDAFYTWNGSRALDGLLLLGDNAYATGTLAEYQAKFFDIYPATLRNTTVWSAYGNHDSYSADSISQSGPYFDIFTFPRGAESGGVASGTEAYYSFDLGNVHFVVLDSMTAAYRSPAGLMMTWLQQDLAAVADRDWIVALWHHPPYTKGSHNSDTEIELVEMRQNFLPVLEQAGVDLVLCGHSHSYERSYLIDSHYGLSTTFTNAMKKDGGSGQPAGTGAYRKPTRGQAAHEGSVYAVPGSAGQISGGTLDHPAMFLSLNRLGSLVLDINGARLDATFLDDGAAPAVLDSFTLFKGGPQPRAVPDGFFVPGLPMKVAKQGGNLAVSWDVSGCRASAQYEILHGAGAGLSSYTLSGAACDIGNRGSYAWNPPALPGGQTLLWWWVVGTDGKSQEGSWGLSGAGVEPLGATAASGFCGTTTKNILNACP